jgi:hypothetical protein
METVAFSSGCEAAQEQKFGILTEVCHEGMPQPLEACLIFAAGEASKGLFVGCEGGMKCCSLQGGTE